ncbi:phosphotransferase family protein [Thermobifida alba]|uniref:Phosphotransferase family protein n=1 Tax=Thermobifida alba TaxID=53522 RepID=A0ABY4KYJ6_THEAE|nr:phosphotransferase family protein [Thermobifida alba]UPT20502.1 phosphotransferase family protein [Thermobifida alba]
MKETQRAEVAPVRPGEELDWPRLEAYLRASLPELEGEFSVLQFPNGSANLTYQVRFGERRLVVRRPPFGVIATAAHDMHREYRVLSRLYRHFPRAPRALLYCGDEGVIGAHFLVMEYRPGVVVWDSIPESMAGEPDAGRRIGLAVVDALADLHRLRPEECGLADLGRPQGYLERQLRGWRGRWEAVAPGSDTPVHRAGEALAARVPVSGAATILHNDYKVDNCQFAHGDPDRVVSVFDWDMATLGDPLVDVGTLLNYWPGSDGTAALAVPGLERLGLPDREEVVARYSQRVGVPLELADLAWYEAFGCWKTAIIMQQLYVRYLRGETTDARMAERGGQVEALAERALELLGAGGAG